MVNFASLSKKLDSGNLLSSIENFPKQCKQAWNETSRVKLPLNYSQCREVVVAGMGGSTLSSDFLKSLLAHRLKAPLIIINDYHLPFFVSSLTLVIISSYSGNTEESLSCFQEALKKNCRIFVIASGGKLAQWALKKKVPAYIFKPSFNPSNQPRMGLGYSMMAQLALFKKINLLNINKYEVEKAIDSVAKDQYPKNKARALVRQIKNKMIMVVGAQFLKGNAHILANQINENAKNFAAYFLLPELNHHLLEGLRYPLKNKNNLIFLFLESPHYSPVIKKRISLTKKILRQLQIPYLTYLAKGEGMLIEGLKTISFGSWLSYFLALLNKVDPCRIPLVDYFKNKLEGGK